MRSGSCTQNADVNVHWVDATILCSYLLGMVVFGMWMGRGTRSSVEFMVGGRDMPWWAVLCSIVATETSTITFLSVPGLAYTGDLGFLQLPLGYISVAGSWLRNCCRGTSPASCSRPTKFSTGTLEAL